MEELHFPSREFISSWETFVSLEVQPSIVTFDEGTVQVKDDPEPVFFRVRRLRGEMDKQIVISEDNPFLPKRNAHETNAMEEDPTNTKEIE